MVSDGVGCIFGCITCWVRLQNLCLFVSFLVGGGLLKQLGLTPLTIIPSITGFIFRRLSRLQSHTNVLQVAYIPRRICFLLRYYYSTTTQRARQIAGYPQIVYLLFWPVDLCNEAFKRCSDDISTILLYTYWFSLSLSLIYPCTHLSPTDQVVNDDPIIYNSYYLYAGTYTSIL